MILTRDNPLLDARARENLDADGLIRPGVVVDEQTILASVLRTIEVARIDPKWASPVTSPTGYAVAALFYWVFCYSMSRYAKHMELRLSAGQEHR